MERLDDEIIRKIYELKKEKKSKREISRTLQISVSTVVSYLRLFEYSNIQIPKAKTKRKYDYSYEYYTINNEKVRAAEVIKVPKVVLLRKKTNKKSQYKPVEIGIGEQLFYAKHGSLPNDAVEREKGSVEIRSASTKIQKIVLEDRSVVFSQELLDLKIGDAVSGIALGVDVGTRGSGVRYDTIHLGFLERVEDAEEAKIQKEIEEETIEINYSKAIEGASVFYEGDADVKEIFMYAYCYFDENKPFETSVPIMLYGLSGTGKSVFLDGLKLSMKAYVTRASRVRSTLVGMLSSEGKVLYPTLPKIFVVDELDKAESKHLFDVLPVFGREERESVSYAKVWKEATDFWAIGTMLRNLGQLKDPRRKDVLFQLSRRCVALQLSSNKPKELTEKIMKEEMCEDDESKNITDINTEITELKKVKMLAEVTKKKGKMSFEDWDWTENFLSEECEKFFLTEDYYWAGDLRRLIIRLAKGRALAYGRSIVEKEDIKYVFEVLESHAKSLGYWKETESEEEREPVDYLEPGICEVCDERRFVDRRGRCEECRQNDR